MIANIDQLIELSVQEVFSTMLNLQLRSEPKENKHFNGEQHVAGSVGFIGRLTGVVYIYCAESFARRITCGLLGLEDREIESDEMVNDALGEMTNMVVGNVKSRLADRGMPCVLTIPSIVRGKNFTIEPVSTIENRLFYFRCDPHQLLVEVLIRRTGEEAG